MENEKHDAAWKKHAESRLVTFLQESLDASVYAQYQCFRKLLEPRPVEKQKVAEIAEGYCEAHNAIFDELQRLNESGVFENIEKILRQLDARVISTSGNSEAHSLLRLTLTCLVDLDHEYGPLESMETDIGAFSVEHPGKEMDFDDHRSDAARINSWGVDEITLPHGRCPCCALSPKGEPVEHCAGCNRQHHKSV